MWIWWTIACHVALLAVLMLSRFQVRIVYRRRQENDYGSTTLRWLFGLKTSVYELTELSLRPEGIVAKAGATAGKRKRGGLRNKTFDAKSIRLMWRKQLYMVRHIRGFANWAKDTLRHVECTELRWVNRLEFEDAAVTAVVVGACWSVSTTTVGWLGRWIRFRTRPHVDFQPQYNLAELSIDFAATLRIRIFYLVWASVRLAIRARRFRLFWRGLSKGPGSAAASVANNGDGSGEANRENRKHQSA